VNMKLMPGASTYHHNFTSDPQTTADDDQCAQLPVHYVLLRRRKLNITGARASRRVSATLQPESRSINMTETINDRPS
jgi:hypothetical protein